MNIKEMRAIYEEVFSQPDTLPKRCPRVDDMSPQVEAVLTDPDYKKFKPDVMALAASLKPPCV